MCDTTVNQAAGPAFQYVSRQSGLSRHDADDVLDFWRKEGALIDPAAARQRIGEVVLFARADDGAVAGVCTARECTLPQIGQPMYYYRSFIGARFRGTRLVYNLVKQAQSILEAESRARDWPCIGIILELENSRFRGRGRQPIWPHLDFVYAGKSGRGLDLRVYYFPGARLKPQ